MNKLYTKPSVEITALNAEDIIMTSPDPAAPAFTKTEVNSKDAVTYGAQNFNIFDAISGN